MTDTSRLLWRRESALFDAYLKALDVFTSDPTEEACEAVAEAHGAYRAIRDLRIELAEGVAA